MQEQDPNEYRMPHRINEPLTFILWPMNQIAPVFACLGVGIVFERVWLSLLFGLFLFNLIRHVEQRYPRGMLIHWGWWYGLADLFVKRSKTVPDPLKKEYFG